MSVDAVARAAWSALEAGGSVPDEVDAALGVPAIDAVVRAGELHLRLLGRLGGAVETKSSRRDLVTEADVEAERLVVEALRAAAPSHAIEAEEETVDARDDRPRWFLDPLDGTVNFVHELPLFAVSLALYRGRRPLFGVVHAPRLGETFVAAAGAGAWLVETGVDRPRRLRVSPTSELADAILATGFPYLRGEVEHSNLENFQRFFHDVRGLRRMGSAALDLAYVAAGRLDGFWELHLSPYDVAAGALLVQEAGGEVTDALGGDDWLRGGEIVAAGAGLIEDMRGRIVSRGSSAARDGS
ncbi:MAG: inositol monophosphatase family protein [Planctomycetota bacterium]